MNRILSLIQAILTKLLSRRAYRVKIKDSKVYVSKTWRL